MSPVPIALVLGTWLAAPEAPAEAPAAEAPAAEAPAAEAPAAAAPAPAVEAPAVEAPAAAAPAPAAAPVSRAERRARFRDAAVFDIVGGGSRRRAWAAGLQGGYPWFGLRGQVGVGPRGLAVGADLETALFRRFRPALLLALRWVDRPRVRLTGETLLGWLVQGGELARRGPNVELRLRFAVIVGRAAPYLMAGTSHTLLTDRTTIITAVGETRDLSFRHEWVPRATLGVAVALTRSVGLDVGIDLAWYNAPSKTPSLPGLHLGLAFGGGPR